MNVAHIYERVRKAQEKTTFCCAKVVIIFRVDSTPSNNERKRTPPKINTQPATTPYNPKIIVFAKYFIGENFRSTVGVSDVNVVCCLSPILEKRERSSSSIG